MHAAVDPGCNENVHQICEHPNCGRVLVATEVMAMWRRSGDGRALRTGRTAGDAAANHTFRFVRRSEESRNVTGRSPTTGLPGSQGWHFYE